MVRRMVLAVCCALSLLLAGHVHAATVHVQPTDTLSAVLARLRSGDTLHLHAGIYTASLIVQPPFPAGVRIEGEAGVLLRPSGCTGIDVRGAVAGLTLARLTLDGTALRCGGGQTSHGIALNGPAHHLTVEDVTIRDVSNPGGGTAVGLSSSANDITLRHLTVSGTHRQPGDFQGSHCLYLAAPGNRNQVLGGTFAHCGGYGIQFNDSAGKGAGGNSGGLIQGATVFDNGRRTTGSGGGIVLNNHQHTTVVTGNTVRDQAKGPGIDVWGTDNHDNVVTGNTLSGNPGGCVVVGVSTTTTATVIQDNTCTGAGARIRLFPQAMGTRLRGNQGAVEDAGQGTGQGGGTLPRPDVSPGGGLGDRGGPDQGPVPRNLRLRAVP
jgi:hypothetical protein